MPLHTRVLHDESEYLVSEEASVPLQPRVRVFARHDDPTFPDPPGPEVKTDQGLWLQVAAVDEGEFQPPDGATPEQVELLQRMLARYLDMRAERDRNAVSSCFYLLVQDRPVYSIHRAQPGGLLLSLFRTEEHARRVLGRLGQEGLVIPTGSLREFLILRAEEGFAGALLDEEEPVYWCLDPREQIQFLRIRPDPEEDGLEGHLLDGAGRWQELKGEEDLTFFEDEESWDGLMNRLIGTIPFLGYEGPTPLYYLRRDAAELVLEDPDLPQEGRYLPLFHDPQAAEEFVATEGIDRAEVVDAQDLVGLLRSIQESGALARLHPGDHRARGGVVWADGDSVVIQTFSGFWRRTHDRSFSWIP